MTLHYYSSLKPSKLKPSDTVIIDQMPEELIIEKWFGDEGQPIRIYPLPTPHCQTTRIHIKDCKHLILDGLGVLNVSGVDNQKPLVTLDTHYCTVQNLRIETVDNTFMWSSEDWEAIARRGIIMRGKENKAINNKIRNTSFAIEAYGLNDEVLNNQVTRFCGDGIRYLNNDQRIAHNFLALAFMGNPNNHLDFIQGWNHTAKNPQVGSLHNIRIEHNTVYNPMSEFFNYGITQGIGCYDGTIENSTFAYNRVVTNHNHALTLASAQQCHLLGNELTHTNPLEKAWLMLGTNKADHPDPHGNLIQDNAADEFHVPKLELLDFKDNRLNTSEQQRILQEMTHSKLEIGLEMAFLSDFSPSDTQATETPKQTLS